MKFLFLALLILFFLGNPSFSALNNSGLTQSSPASGGLTFLRKSYNYQAVVLGKVLKKEVKKSEHLYITEYKVKTKKWLFKKPEIKEKKILTISILGAELPEQGLVIKASSSPDFIPIKKDVIFLLEKTRSDKNDIFTVSKNGIIFEGGNFSLRLDQIEELFKQIKEI